MIATALLLTALGSDPASQDPASDAWPTATPASQGLSPETVAELDAKVAEFVTRQWIVGAELLIVKNRHVVHHGAHGWRDRDEQRPMEPDTIFNLRSMAKPLVGMAAQQLIETGELSRDTPVAGLLSSFAGGDSARITVGHLLSHRSGLPDGNPAGSPDDYDGLRAVADYWGAHGPTEFPPGERFRYSDPGTDVLGAVVAEVSGSPLQEAVEELVLRPLGLHDTFALTDAEDPRVGRASSNYLEQGPRWVRYWKPGDAPLAPFVIGSGTVWYGTPRDYARLLVCWMDGGVAGGERLLEPDTVARALTPISPMPYPSHLGDHEVWYGEMWLVYCERRPRGQKQPGRRVAFGHSGSDGTYAWAFPDQDLIVLYFTQSRGQRSRMLLEPLIQALREGMR